MPPTTCFVTITAAFLSAAAAPFAAHAQCTPTFANPVQYAPDIPLAIYPADLNGDGRIDLVTSGIGAGTNVVNVLLNSVNGAFANPVRYQLASSGGAIITPPVDLNGDGKLDLVISLGSGNTNFGVMLGNGAGGFSAPTYIPIGASPFAIYTADFNQDGKADVLALNGSTGAFMLMYGNGNGTFLAPVTIPNGGLANAVGDFNGDGKPDLAVAAAAFGNTVTIWYGTGVTGAGAFTVGPTYPATSPRMVTVSDLDGDGKLDLVVGLSTPQATIFRGSGTGTFTDVGTFNTNVSPSSITVADLNGDGKRDLVVGNSGPANVYMLLGTGVLTAPNAFGAPTPYAVPGAPVVVAPADLNSDGSPDLAAATSSSGQTLSILLNTSPGYYRPVITQQPAAQIVASGASVQFTAAATGFGPALTYSWRRNGAPLVNGGNISGATTPALTINPATQSDVAFYTLVVSSAPACGSTNVSVTSSQVVLGITGGSTPAGCVADLGATGGLPGHDGALDNNDFIAFINAFFNHTGCP
ncbi:MAG: FG-GAP-like repeat-containing protein [Phycisphaerales bacterium]